MTDTAASEAGRALAARRPRLPFICEACGKEYTAVVKSDRENRACSSTCRSRLFREAKRANGSQP
jgi:hypothetical protein